MALSQILGQQLHQRRKELGLSKEKMAELCGVCTRHYYKLEEGLAIPRLDTALHIYHRAGISLHALPYTPCEEEENN